MPNCPDCKTPLTSAAIEFRRCTICGQALSDKATTTPILTRVKDQVAQFFGGIPIIRLLVSPDNRVGTHEARQATSLDVATDSTESTSTTAGSFEEAPAVDQTSTSTVPGSSAHVESESTDSQSMTVSNVDEDSGDIMETMDAQAQDGGGLASLAKIPEPVEESEGMATISDVPASEIMGSDEFEPVDAEASPLETMDEVPDVGGLSSGEFELPDESEGSAMETIGELPADKILSDMADDSSALSASVDEGEEKTVSDASDNTVEDKNFVEDTPAESNEEPQGMETISEEMISSMEAEEFDSGVDDSDSSESEAMQTIDAVSFAEAPPSEFGEQESVVESEGNESNEESSAVVAADESPSSMLGSFGSMGIDDSKPLNDVASENDAESVAAPSTDEPESIYDTVDEADDEFDGSQVGTHQIGKFELNQAIGSGSFGTVYKGRDPELDRDVAIKVPHSGILNSEEELARFIREGRAAASLRHANICPVYEIGKDGEQHFIVMAYIQGKTLSNHLAERGHFSDRQAAIAARKLAQALQVAHDAGIIHRDLKPANIIVDDFREPVIMDFGLARRESANDAKLTQTGQIMGTPAYMAPEQALGEIDNIGPATDVYSLGTILYEMLTGCRPFQGSVGEIMSKIVKETPAPISSHRADIDANLVSICERAMAREIAERYSTMTEFASDLSAFLVGESPASSKPAKEERPVQIQSLIGSLKLVVTAGADAGKVFPLAEELNLVGRSRLCAITVNDPAVSKIHCRIRISGNKVSISDANSSWGTIVNGEKVTDSELRPGDSIKLGATRMLVETADDIDASEYRSDPDTVHPHQAEAAQSADDRTAPVPVAESDQTADDDDADAGREYPRVPPKDNLADLVGTTFIRYEIREILARARTGMLFHAFDTKRERPVALKILWPELSKQRDEVRRFIRAIKTMMGIKHENLIALYGAGKTGSYCFTASEYIDGQSVSDVIKQVGIAGMMEWQQSFRIMLHVARALEVAFQHQIVHRNISPQNVIVRSSDSVAKLGDLMLAKALEGSLAEKITQPGEIVGELAYLAPEQTGTAQEIDCRADLYSLGATVYAILTGNPPLKGDSPAKTIMMIRDETPERPSKVHMSIPGQFEDVVMRLLEKRPADRFQTPNQLVREHERLPKFLDVMID